MITESMVRGNPKEAADIIATLEQEVAALEAREAALVNALEALVMWKDAVDLCAPQLGGLLLAMYHARSLISAQEGK